LKQVKLIFSFLVVVAVSLLFCGTSWADGGDPKGTPINGSGSTPITLTNPNPTVYNVAAQTPSASNDNCLGSSYCVDAVFQNQTGQTLTSLTMFFSATANPGLTFTCGDMTQASFFDVCTPLTVTGGQELIFSADGENGFNGVAPATQQCVPDSVVDYYEALILGPSWCTCLDPDDYQFVGGEFGILLYGTDVSATTHVTEQAVTAPEPGAGLMVIIGALVFGVLSLVRRAV